jgi:hypothetical protein
VARLVIAPAARPRTTALLPHHYYASPTAQHCRRESEGWCCVCSVSRHWHARAMQTDTHTIPRKPASDHQPPPPPHMPFLMAADGHSHRIQQPAGQVVICEPPTPTLSKKAGGAWWRARHSQGATWFDQSPTSSLSSSFSFATKQRVRGGITPSQNHGQHVANAAPRAHLTEKPDLLLACLRPPPLGRSSGHGCDRHPNTTNQIRGFS